MNKKKIFNDPVYGFITVPSELLFDIIDHPYFQRLRRIKQLGLTEMVYPGALHTRFHHALGAMHLMNTALQTLKSKNNEISDKEFEASLIAILLHDIGHGPFSHALETAIFKEVHHEHLSLHIMHMLNEEFGGRLGLAIDIFTDKYERRFFHQLVSSQLDVDRLDYLNRDSFYTGVYEGKIGADRIIKMLDVANDKLVVEEKAIYSIENFLVSRRLMYWQVYLHKTVISAENMVLRAVQRARQLLQQGIDVPASPCLKFFLASDLTMKHFQDDATILERFVSLDDHDIWSGIKQWASHSDSILSYLSGCILNRKLFKVIISNKPVDEEMMLGISELIQDRFKVAEEDIKYLMISGKISNNAYQSEGQSIDILTKAGYVVDAADASDLPNIQALSNKVEKYYVCYPREVAN
ncbi:HD domain-containing protein [Pontibacter sp. BT310]|uniref:HD domain-containing protein n=1 Tax=Pontibacter populi TaxID=890055 RepID=A0ABS6XBZ2_9BACT|nr:HD domain-containing protein [Pontibacter populi]MBJ6118666.1 HD domain-containing protein [Pontibacter sp. BT310]MBR0571095.1 HD domain-containing protein [Microvirga sp. STS03]MBW3365520.1 HD domain-containing protein [Pontibacter populi]